VYKNTLVSYDIANSQSVLKYWINDKQDFVMVRNFLGNAFLYAQISVFKNSFETEGDSVDTWLERTTLSLPSKPTIKKKITYK